MHCQKTAKIELYSVVGLEVIYVVRLVMLSLSFRLRQRLVVIHQLRIKFQYSDFAICRGGKYVLCVIQNLQRDDAGLRKGL